MERAIFRQQQLLKHLQGRSPDEQQLAAVACSTGEGSSYVRSTDYMDDVVIVTALRTPFCRANKGPLKDTFPDDLMAVVLKGVIDQSGVNPADVGDIVAGSIIAPSSQRAIDCRMAQFYAGYPETVPLRTINRVCASGLQAVADVAASIRAGFYSVGVAAGMETMTFNPLVWAGSKNPDLKAVQNAQSCLVPLGVTAENVADRYGVTRQEQDQAAVDSHSKAAAARAAGKFRDEIVPVATKVVNPENGDETPVLVTEDDGIRPGATLQDLARLKPVFKQGGATTAGNSSQLSDGAAAVLLMTRREATKRNLPILGVFRAYVTVGVDPAVMGIGPAVAIPAVLKQAGLTIDDIDLFEINEAFASQFVYCVKKLGLDESKVNVNGGAIALGHPLGATGARCVATLLHEMKRRGKDCRFGVISMCMGSGMGAAAVIERGSIVDSLSNATTTNVLRLSRDAL